MKSDAVRGTCLLMCPESEIQMRQREGLVHVLETRDRREVRKGERIMADRRRMVKSYSRSAAGKDMLCADVLRPPPVLKRTINYLLSVAVCETNVAWPTVYEFVTDRLRSVRQDMVIQQPPAAVCCSILEPMVRFHAYAAYRLCEEPLEVYDPHLNATHLNESLKQLLVSYDASEISTMSPAQDQMEALYGLLHLGNVDALYRMLSLTPSKDGMLDIALQMSIARFHNNYVRVCRLMKHLPPLLACVAALHLPSIRRNALSVMNSAYSSKNLHFPVEHLGRLLLYESDKEVIEDCSHYGLRASDSSVTFLKGSFDFEAKDSKVKKLGFVDESIASVSLPELLLSDGDPES
ncbi:SAC3 domain-containing protein 1 isoform X2 [Homalodisca vitripennis]|nr:SAC3 domain-containing protein 1 isoform X2 [Homalodisca vitripennis]XP_046681091.1 SAC3 domain-containing protein 1 isoform X2 [Homalodisca vitripennis]